MKYLERLSIFFFVSLLLISVQVKGQYDFDLQGHRGARGLMPENSIPGFLEALKQGVNTLELDLAVTKDHQLLVSHDPYFSASICLDSLGNDISEEDQKSYNIYEHSYAAVTAYDCGSKGNPGFPSQKPLSTTKPLLADVINAVDGFIAENNLGQVNYNIEIKSSPEGDNKFHPEPAVFSKLLYEFLQERLPAERVTIQSFDFRVLQYWRLNYPEYQLAALIGNRDSIEENLQKLGFNPAIYSPYFKLIDEGSVTKIQRQGMLVLPWTVNELEDMERLLSWGVDGIITDYPDRAKQLQN